MQCVTGSKHMTSATTRGRRRCHGGWNWFSRSWWGGSGYQLLTLSKVEGWGDGQPIDDVDDTITSRNVGLHNLNLIAAQQDCPIGESVHRRWSFLWSRPIVGQQLILTTIWMVVRYVLWTNHRAGLTRQIHWVYVWYDTHVIPFQGNMQLIRTHVNEHVHMVANSNRHGVQNGAKSITWREKDDKPDLMVNLNKCS